MAVIKSCGRIKSGGQFVNFTFESDSHQRTSLFIGRMPMPRKRPGNGLRKELYGGIDAAGQARWLDGAA